MNYLVYLDTHANELEKILSGIKSMLIKEFDPAVRVDQTIKPGDNLYFLRNRGDCDLRVQATVSHILSLANLMDTDLSHILKELQPKLQLTEEQYNHWSIKKQALLIEFEDAHKIGPIHIPDCKFTISSDWMAFEGFDLITDCRPQ